MSSTYALALPDFLTDGRRDAVWLLRDRARPHGDSHIDAYVRSGDYFVMLATTIENIAAELPEISVVATGLALSKLVDELSYVQKHYRIVPKQHSDDLTELG